MEITEGKIKVFLMLQIFLGLFLGCLTSEGNSQVKKQSLEKVILGISGSKAIINLPFDMGKKEGFYRNEGIDLEIMIMKGNITTAALNSGSVDYGGAPGNLIRASALGMPFKAIFLIADKLPQYVVSKPDIKSPKAMKGRSLGVGSLGGDNSLMAMEIVRFFGLDPERDVTIVGTGPDLKLQALMAGSVDASLVNSKEALMAKGRGFNILAKAADIIQMPGYGLGTTDKKIREARNSVKRTVRATLKGFLLVKEKKRKF